MGQVSVPWGEYPPVPLAQISHEYTVRRTVLTPLLIQFSLWIQSSDGGSQYTRGTEHVSLSP